MTDYLFQAQAFLRTARAAQENGDHGPAYECARTAAELAAKAMLSQTGIPPKRHNVANLLVGAGRWPAKEFKRLSQFMGDDTRGIYGFHERSAAKRPRGRSRWPRCCCRKRREDQRRFPDDRGMKVPRGLSGPVVVAKSCEPAQAKACPTPLIPFGLVPTLKYAATPFSSDGRQEPHPPSPRRGGVVARQVPKPAGMQQPGQDTRGGHRQHQGSHPGVRWQSAGPRRTGSRRLLRDGLGGRSMKLPRVSPGDLYPG